MFTISTCAAAAADNQASEAEVTEINVCVGKTCRKDGGLQTLDHFRGLAPPHVNVDSCGCLGRCGAGPNLVLLPSQTIIRHCSTAAHAARLLERQCAGGSAETNLAALELKGRGNAAFEKGRADEAEMLFTQAIELVPVGGIHNLLCNRSAARVACGNPMGALEDAEAAAALKPGWSSAVIRRGEALAALGRVREALEVYERLADTDAEFRRSKQFLVSRVSVCLPTALHQCEMICVCTYCKVKGCVFLAQLF
ncbi:unnamed protein product [Closterium sp. Naga37s-1]|nr:unnamed protein product [Closterium sp. Naga37s-1]